MQLGLRDQDVLTFLTDQKAAPLDVLARRYFAVNPQTGKQNKDPLGACSRRMLLLVREGYVDIEVVREKGRTKRTRVARMTAKAAKLMNVATPGRVHGRARDHHYETLRAGTHLEEKLKARGYEVEPLRLEHALRAEGQSGSAVRAGMRFESFPDAELRAKDAAGKTFKIAVEYVTSKYSDADIVGKAQSFAANYDRVEWIGDSTQTAARITRLTGQPAVCRF